MPTYECQKCGMSINATCGKCGATLVNDTLKSSNDKDVTIAKCPNDHGKIKSPTCCGEDMKYVHTEEKSDCRDQQCS